jgi:predicted permease
MRWPFRRRKQHDRDLNDEVAFDLAAEAEERIRSGIPREQAERESRRDFGNVLLLKEDVREVWGWTWLERLGQDLCYGWRTLRQNPLFTVMAVLSLALGIGATTVIFSAVNGLLLKTVPVSHPENLVRIRWTGANDMMNGQSSYGYIEKGGGSTLSYPMYQELRASNQTLSDLIAFAPSGNQLNVIADGQAEIGTGLLVSGNYYGVLGVAPELGRVITPEDDRAAAVPVAVISSAYWRGRFGADPRIVGKAITVNSVEVTIIGVIPSAFTGIQRAGDDLPDVTFPLALDMPLGGRARLSTATEWWVEVMGRLRPGFTPQQVQGNLDGVFQQTSQDGWNSYLGSLTPAQRSLSRYQNRTKVPHLLVDSGSRGMYLPSPADIQPVTILSIVVVLILLIVCANVANLLLSRAATRQKEISVRLSLGATRLRLIRQLLTESVLLSAIGGLLGMLVTYWGRTLIPGITTEKAQIDWRVFGFMAALSLLTGIAFGLAPALRATRSNLAGDLKEAGRSISGTRSLLSKSLIVAQVAISLVLLIAAGLFLQTLGNLKGVDVGFNSRNILMFRLNPSLNGYDQSRIASIYQQISESLRSIPGVRTVSLTNRPQLKNGNSAESIFVQGHEAEHAGDNLIMRTAVSPDFFAAMGIPLLVGRVPTERDDLAAPKVAVINEAAARKYFAGASPVGQRFGYFAEGSGVTEVIGVVRDAKYNSLRDPAPPIQYVPLLQQKFSSVIFVLRTAPEPTSVLGAVRSAVRQVDPNLPLTDVSTQTERIEELFGQERVFAVAYTVFGVLALLLACIGLFGLMSYSVARRTNEMGIRMALGAQASVVIRLVMRESLILVFLGVIVGLSAALAASRLITTLLFGLSSTDVGTIAVAVTIMIVVSVLAGYLPARRASRVDPLTALRYE